VKNATSKAAYNALASAGLVEAGGAGAEGQGIVYFELIEEALTSGSTSPFTGLSTDNLATLAQDGYISLAQLSGTDTAGNETTDIVLTGRSEDSGSRANAFACAFEGGNVGATTQLQYQPFYSGAFQTYSDNGSMESNAHTATVEEGGTGSTLTSLSLWPGKWGLNSDTTIFWTKAGLGGGFNSGGNLALAMSATNPITTVSFTDANGNAATAVYVVTYLAGADAATCVAGSPVTLNTTNAQATRLSYNGVQYSQAAVLNGSYNIWGYEHAYYLPSATGVAQNAMDDIAKEVETVTAEDDAFLDQNVTTDAAVGIFLPANVGGTEEVNRSAPGVPPTEDY